MTPDRRAIEIATQWLSDAKDCPLMTIEMSDTLCEAVLSQQSTIQMLEGNLKLCVKELESAKATLEYITKDKACVANGCLCNDHTSRFAVQRIENFLLGRRKMWGDK